MKSIRRLPIYTLYDETVQPTDVQAYYWASCGYGCKNIPLKARFPLGGFVRANRQKIGTVPTCSRRIFSPITVPETEGTFVCACVKRGMRGVHKSRDFGGIFKSNRGNWENLHSK